MSEKGMRRRVIQVLKKLDAIAVENPAYPGTPDVWYMEGALELKWARKWPTHEDTPLRMPHFTRQQKLWLAKRWNMGGEAYLLLKVGREWLLFDGLTAGLVIGTANKAELRAAAISSWRPSLSERELLRILKNGRSTLS